MISVNEAERLILANVKTLPVVTVPLTQAVGRILREEIVSDREQPPFNKVLMDGIAINIATKSRVFHIEETIAAGDKTYTLKNPRNCAQVMTGAVLPLGCDCVIPIEQVKFEGDNALLTDWTMLKPKQFIRYKGADAKKGQVLIKTAKELSSVHIGVLASVGKSQVKVTALPSIAVISTGDELVDINKPLKPHQTRMSNAYALKALFDDSGLGVVSIFHLKDNKVQMKIALTKILKDFDVIVLSGGVSTGEFDFVPKVLTELRVKQLFHKVTQKPGKPFWFGLTGTQKPVFALPGNPVSTQIGAYRYIIPYLRKAAGLKNVQHLIKLTENVNIDSDLTHFLPVKDGKIVQTGGSGDFSALVNADGFIEYDHSKKENSRPYFSWRV